MNHAPDRQGDRRLPADTERGSATIELVLLIPVLLLMLWFVLICIRLPDARLRVEDAAHQAARAASSARSPAAAEERARTTAAAALRDAGISCQSFTLDSHGSMQPGSTVAVDLACTVGLSDLALLGVPGTTVLHARFAAPVDTYRGTAARASQTAIPPSSGAQQDTPLLDAAPADAGATEAGPLGEEPW